MHKPVECLGKDAAQVGGYVWIAGVVEMWITAAERTPAASLAKIERVAEEVADGGMMSR